MTLKNNAKQKLVLKKSFFKKFQSFKAGLDTFLLNIFIKMIFRLAFLFGFSFSNTAEAVQHAASLKEWDQIQRQNQQIEEFYHICRRQIKNKKIPSACWRGLKLTKTFDPHFEKYLNLHCQKLFIESLNLKQVSSALKNYEIDSVCREFLKRAHAVLKYQNQAPPEPPAEIKGQGSTVLKAL